ncbi:MAG: Ku C terminal domain like [Phormidesmis priestleyi Ana]|uniref:Ku C terminal domain like n=1 Tax=Phormidesmis priestleyi Ana TaxID=1666911 RepID=A0A0P7ZBB4_9CYAN|nr:MAG: Ku C terminal domain like [Phormidesmis priestleyi Ana]
MEYQCYEFQAIDRPLTKAEQDYVQSLSSRVRPTATSAVFTYSYGDFRGSPLSVLERCFDAMLYMANWGSYQLAFRFPESAVNVLELKPYCVDNIIEVLTVEKYVILNIEIHSEEGGGWIEENNSWLGTLLPIRQAILQGDYRVLYLAWLQAATVSSYLEQDAQEPPVPPNLQKLSDSLQSFADWLEIDSDLIAAAAQISQTQEELKDPFEAWVKALSDKEKTKLLVEIVTGDSAIASQLQARLRQKFAPTSEILSISDADRRRFAELVALAETQRSERQANEKATAAAKRHQYLETLKPQQAQIWETIDGLIARKQAQSYQQAIQHLIDLRDLAELEGKPAIFQDRVRQLQANYSNRSGLIRRMREAKLLRRKN